MLTRETDYALRAVLCLAGVYGEGRPLTASDLAAEMEIPYRFLRVLIRKLVAAKIVTSRRGNGGGLTLARPPAEVCLLDVVRAMDRNSLILNRCLTVPDEHSEMSGCSRRRICTIHKRLAGVQKALDRALSSLNFAELNRSPRRRRNAPAGTPASSATP